MIGIICSTWAEANELTALLAAVKIADSSFETYSFDASAVRPAGRIVISGMGPARAAAATLHLIEHGGVTAVLNVGVCGALQTHLEPGQLLRVRRVIDGDADGQADAGAAADASAVAAVDVGREPWQYLAVGRLASVAEPVFGGERRSQLSQLADVVDMEGFAVAQACERHGVAWHLVKGVSDRADGDGRAAIQENLPWVSARLARAVVDGLANWPADAGRSPGPRSAANLPARLAALVKIEHSIFSLPLLFAGAYLGAGGHWPGMRVLALIALAGVGARTLGMAMNRILDRRLDALNARTAGRGLPAGTVSPRAAWALAGGGLGVYVLACAALGPLCLMLAAVPAVPLVLYSLLKRFTCLCHFGIGLCMALAPLAACVASSGNLDFPPAVLLLAGFAFCWISGFDIIYALQDMDSDRRTGVRSLPARLGSRGAQVAAAAVHVAALACIAWLWRLGGGGLIAGVALAVTAGALAAAYVPAIPLAARFFPVSAIAGVAGAMVPLLGGVA